MKRRKIDSARRWKARFKIGKWVPALAIMQHPKLRKLSGSSDPDFSVNVDAIRLKIPNG